MSEVWVTSDTHFGHANIIRYCGRPFKDVDEMNEALVANWNSVVAPVDTVIHLGDVFFGHRGHVLEHLNGKKKLILGNHDPVGTGTTHGAYTMSHFTEIMLERRIDKMLMTHMPVHPHGLEFTNGPKCNVHGHIHEMSIPDRRYKCVSVEHTSYTPVNLSELIEWSRQFA